VVTGLQRSLFPRRVPFVVSVVTACVSGSIAAGALLTPLMLSPLGLDTTLLVSGLVFPLLSLLLLPKLIATDVRLVQRADELAPRTSVLQGLGL
jgi:hypothetical protein